MDERAKAASDIPLVVDLDGTLIKTDTLHEAFVQLGSAEGRYRLCTRCLAITRGRA